MKDRKQLVNEIESTRKVNQMFNDTGKTALITGASSELGESFARELAARGMNVVLVARSEAKLHLLAQELSQRHHVRAEALPSAHAKCVRCRFELRGYYPQDSTRI